MTREFPFGFLCAGVRHKPTSKKQRWETINASWTRCVIGGFCLWTEPRLPIIRRGDDKQCVVILGDVVSFDGRPATAVANELLTADPLPALDHLGGRFAVLIIGEGRCRVAHDAFGSRSVFYMANREFAVASHAALLACAYDVGRDERIAEFMRYAEFRKRSVRYLPGDMTVYRDIFALTPNNFLDSNGNRTGRYWPRVHRQQTTLEDFYSEMDAYFRAFVPFVAGHYKPIFGITGGVDSRAVYCGFRRHNASFRGVTWGAGYMQKAEEPVIQSLIACMGIEHAFLDPRDHPSKDFGSAAAVSGGNYRGKSALTEAMGAEYGADSAAVFVRGYGGEIVRGFYNLRKRPIQDLSPEALVAAYGSSMRGVKPTADYKKMCAGFFIDFRKRANYDRIESFGYDPNDVFYWEHRMGMWGSAMLNEMDPAIYSLVGFNSRPLYIAAFGLDPKLRLNKQLLREVIARNDEQLASIPYE